MDAYRRNFLAKIAPLLAIAPVVPLIASAPAEASGAGVTMDGKTLLLDGTPVLSVERDKAGHSVIHVGHHRNTAFHDHPWRK